MSVQLERAFEFLRQGAAADEHGVVPTTALLTSALVMNLISIERIRAQAPTAERRRMLAEIRNHARAARDQFRKLAAAAEGLEVDVAELLSDGGAP